MTSALTPKHVLTAGRFLPKRGIRSSRVYREGEHRYMIPLSLRSA